MQAKHASEDARVYGELLSKLRAIQSGSSRVAAGAGSLGGQTGVMA